MILELLLQSETEENFKCLVCKLGFIKAGEFKKHMATHNQDGAWICNICSFQTKSEKQLRAHESATHPSANQLQGEKDKTDWPKAEGGDVNQNKRRGNYSCRTCSKDFIYKIDLTKHMKETHKMYNSCRDIQACTYKDSRQGCRYNHKEYPERRQVCFECGKNFKTVHDLMRHRKADHMVPICKDFLANSCGYSTSNCYYTHNKHPHPQIPVKKSQESTQADPQIQGFWEEHSNMAPPFQRTKVL